MGRREGQVESHNSAGVPSVVVEERPCDVCIDRRARATRFASLCWQMRCGGPSKLRQCVFHHPAGVPSWGSQRGAHIIRKVGGWVGGGQVESHNSAGVLSVRVEEGPWDVCIGRRSWRTVFASFCWGFPCWWMRCGDATKLTSTMRKHHRAGVTSW